MLKNFGRITILWFLMGSAYFLIELLWRLPQGGIPHPVMLTVGGVCGVTVGGINQKPQFQNMPVILQAFGGTVMTLLYEYAFGLLINKLMGLNVWNYSKLFGNVSGQICIPFGIAWFFIMPTAIWLDDYLRWGFGWSGRKYSLATAYLNLVRGK